MLGSTAHYGENLLTLAVGGVSCTFSRTSQSFRMHGWVAALVGVFYYFARPLLWPGLTALILLINMYKLCRYAAEIHIQPMSLGDCFAHDVLFRRTFLSCAVVALALMVLQIVLIAGI